MTSEGLGDMFEGDPVDTCAGKFPLISMGGRAEGLVFADPEARTPIGASGNFKKNIGLISTIKVSASAKLGNLRFTGNNSQIVLNNTRASLTHSHNHNCSHSPTHQMSMINNI